MLDLASKPRQGRLELVLVAVTVVDPRFELLSSASLHRESYEKLLSRATYVLSDVLAEAIFKGLNLAAKTIILLILRPQISDLTVELSDQCVLLVVEIRS